MPDRGLEPGQKSAITDYLSERFNAHTVILFGSAAREEMRQDSDVDIAFLSDIPAPSAYELFMASSELADLVKRDVDLIFFLKPPLFSRLRSLEQARYCMICSLMHVRWHLCGL
ncbi:nucleotidyltransferase domain-containing protein [Paenibacillus sp. P96]|uniref:Nucleotidyltransferase domain-containing protein n=1 Tax=Paenibacillus zeirhizosphaerae TaxID=2987519 RepID=A0ABT9FNW1_9BACL|nr:nucleotidyltransferase domain-containing protein [Paenibacillus sp. P96]MDP4096320.1 nucleotidyltransferase domain-containing protein [Paenibacillus sp. P96]